MERDHHDHRNQETPPPPPPPQSLPSHHHQSPKEIIFTDQSPRNHIITTNAAANNDRLKRDEWSEGAVSTLLEAYEAKWTLRNRAKLKGQDWEDVAKHVSCRGNGGKSAKTQTQCKNKIESMKKRYRSESSAATDAAASSWPLYSRLDLLLRGINNNGPSPAAAAVAVAVADPPPVVIVEPPQVPPPPPPVPLPPVAAVPLAVVEIGGVKQTSGGDRLAKEEGDGTNNVTKLTNQKQEKNPIIDDTDSSTPAIYTSKKEKQNKKIPVKSNYKDYIKSNKKRTREEYSWEIGESIRWFAEVMVRSEQARMETMRDIERMRVEAEAKRGEMELKRTEIIANTQLQIAKLFAKASVQDWKKST